MELRLIIEWARKVPGNIASYEVTKNSGALEYSNIFSDRIMFTLSNLSLSMNFVSMLYLYPLCLGFRFQRVVDWGSDGPAQILLHGTQCTEAVLQVNTKLYTQAKTKLYTQANTKPYTQAKTKDKTWSLFMELNVSSQDPIYLISHKGNDKTSFPTNRSLSLY